MAVTVRLGRNPPAHSLDTCFLLACVVAAWAALLAGFVPEYRHNTAPGGPGVPPLILVHAAVYSLWTILFTAQVLLVRSGRPQLHRRLGQSGLVLLVAMVPLGLASAFAFERMALAMGGPEAPRFLIVQIMDMTILATLVGTALGRVRRPDWHRRLMLVAMLNLTAPGFARALGHMPFPLPDRGTLGLLAFFDGPSDALIALAILYDTLRHGRLHPAYRAAGGFLIAVQLVAFTILWLPGWSAVARAMLRASPV